MDSQYLLRLRTLLLTFCVCLFFSTTAFSEQEQTTSSSEQTTEEAEQQDQQQKLEETREQLTIISASIEAREKQLIKLRQKLQNTKDEAKQKVLQEQITEVEKVIKASEQSFKSIAAGGVDLNSFAEPAVKKFDWRSDLTDIVKPIFEGLKGLTEKPRTVEKLRGISEFYKNQLRIIEKALAKIQLLEAESLPENVSLQLAEMEAIWLQRQSDAERELKVTDYQLKNILEQQTSFWVSLQEGFSDFFKGRGLTLVLAIVSAIIVWFALKGALKIAWGRKNVDEARIQGAYSRVFVYGYRLLSAFITLMTLLFVLYLSGDWLLLGISILILAALVLSLKNHLFGFLGEAKLILNLGAVREGERVIYNDIPWRVSSLNFYSQLTNPCLQGGVLRLPLSEIATLISRPYQEDEIWFPSKVGDFVLLSDETFGEVLQQTPEVVRLKIAGAARTFSVSDYLGASPRNLSQGSYGFAITFGIDYEHQPICLDEVAPVFKESVQKAIAQSAVGEHLEELIVEFKEAGASSLDYLVFVIMNGKAASSFKSLPRLTQQACVKACNEHNWGIPFAQLTIHQGEGFSKL